LGDKYGNFIILFLTTNFLRRVGSINFITSLSISKMGGQTMRVEFTKKEKSFLWGIYLNRNGDEYNETYSERKTLENFFITVNGKEARQTKKLISLLYFYCSSPDADDSLDNEDITEDEHQFIVKKIEQALS